MELADLKRLTRTLIERNERLFSFVFHSPSLAPGNTPYVRDDDELQAFLNRIEAYLGFFVEELGGEGRSALEIRDLLQSGSRLAAPPTAALPSCSRTTITTKNITRKPSSSIGPHPIEGKSHGHVSAADAVPPPRSQPIPGAASSPAVRDVGRR
jgi:hypothetical protein